MLFKNVASQKVRVFAFADAGHASLDAGEPVTGDAANITANTALDNAALGASNDVNPAEVDATNAPGYYEFDPTQAETNGDVIEWYAKSSTAGVQVVTVGGSVRSLLPPNLPDLGIETDGDLTKVNTLNGHTAQTGDNFARLGAPAGASVSADIATVDANVDTLLTRITSTLFSGITSLAEWLGLMAGKQTGDATARTELRGTGGGSGTYDETTDSLEALRERGDAAWTTGAGSGLTPLASGTAQAGTSSTIQLASGETFADDELNGNVVKITSGTGAGQSRLITDYTGSTDTATVSPDFTTTPDATSVYEVVEGPANLIAIRGDAQSAVDLKDFADAGYDPATNKVEGVKLADTTTTNTDMRGTDNAALASVLGALADAAAAGDPTASDTLVAYMKQIVNVLVGTTGVTTFPAEAAPANNVSLAEVIRAIHADVTGLNGDAMRGTDSAALASVCTEARLSELDEATAGKMANQVDEIRTDTEDVQSRLPSALVGGRMDSDIGAKTGNVALSTQEKADVNTEVLDVLNTDTFAEPGQEAPGATVSLATKIGYLYKFLRNRITQTSTTLNVYSDDGTTVDHKATVSDDATTYDRGEIGTGP